MNNRAGLATLAPVPRVPAEWVRKSELHRTLNDQVEDTHIGLLNGSKREEYLPLLDAVYDEQAVEGSLSADNIMAAQMIRDAAAKTNPKLASQKLATLSKALGVVLRRYGVSRNERRNMVDGEVVATGNGD